MPDVAAGLSIDDPDVLAEVEAALQTYERALSDNDVATLNRLFWDDPRTLRHGIAETLYGHAAIAAYRMGRKAPGRRRMGRTVVTALGRDCASASVEFFFPDDDRVGRQTQIWFRSADGWRIAAAHVSFMPSRGPSSP